MKPVDASKKVNEKTVYSTIQDKTEKRKPNYELGPLVGTAFLRKLFGKGDSTNWLYKLYTITEVIHDTKSSYRLHFFPSDTTTIC